MTATPGSAGRLSVEVTNPYPVPPLGTADLLAIETSSGFWAATPELRLICATAHAKGVGRWALLGAVLTNLLSWLPPYVMLTDKDGDTSDPCVGGSLNFFMHLITESGEGKTRVLNAAKSLIPPNDDRYGTGGDEPSADLISSGTGEGLLKHFVSSVAVADDQDKKGKGTRVMMQRTDVANVHIDEVSTYIGELARTGSKTAGILTSLWSGQLTGSNTSTVESRTKLAQHAARVVVLMLAQPELCAALFTDELISGGTPQRPVWLPGDDWTPCPVQAAPPGVSIHAPKDCWKLLPASLHPQTVHVSTSPTPPGAPVVGGSATAPAPTAPPINTLPPELRFPRPTASPEHAVWIRQPPAARADIIAADAERAKNKLSPAEKAALPPAARRARKATLIQNHMLLTRLKVMVALGLLHNRPNLQPTDEDWVLAGVMMKVSLGMLAYLWMDTRAARRAAAEERGFERGFEKVATDEVVQTEKTIILTEMAEKLWNKLANEVGPRDANSHRRWFSDDRKTLLKEVRARGIEDGLWEKDANNLYYALDPNTGLRKVPSRVGQSMQDFARAANPPTN